MSIALPIDVYSPDQLSGLVAELQSYRGRLRDAAVRAKTAKSKGAVVAPVISEELMSLLRKSGVTADDGDALDTAHKELQKILKKAPVMHITLAALPNKTLKRQLTVWFRTQINPNSLLTFAARSDIGGGLMLQAGSHFYDYSFRERILANKKRLMEIAGA